MSSGISKQHINTYNCRIAKLSLLLCNESVASKSLLSLQNPIYVVETQGIYLIFRRKRGMWA